MTDDIRKEKLKQAMRLVDECNPGEDGRYEFEWLTGISASIRAFIKCRLPEGRTHREQDDG